MAVIPCCNNTFVVLIRVPPESVVLVWLRLGALSQVMAVSVQAGESGSEQKLIARYLSACNGALK